MARARPPELWTIDDLSAYLRKPVRTLYDWRHRGLGPPAYRVGGELRYDPAQVWEWLQANEISGSE